MCLAGAARLDAAQDAFCRQLYRVKAINDGQGHLAGDDLLRGIARALRLRLRSTDILGRYGGDEFVITLPETRADEALYQAKNSGRGCVQRHQPAN